MTIICKIGDTIPMPGIARGSRSQGSGPEFPKTLGALDTTLKLKEKQPHKSSSEAVSPTDDKPSEPSSVAPELPPTESTAADPLPEPQRMKLLPPPPPVDNVAIALVDSQELTPTDKNAKLADQSTGQKRGADVLGSSEMDATETECFDLLINVLFVGAIKC